MAKSSPPPRPDERPELTPDRNVEAAVRDTFPASDPPATTASQGARAVPAETMMDKAGSTPRRPDDAMALTRRFRDQESAKLALETLVREGPIDRRCAEILHDQGGVTLRIEAAGQDRTRLEGLLAKSSGTA